MGDGDHGIGPLGLEQALHEALRVIAEGLGVEERRTLWAEGEPPPGGSCELVVVPPGPASSRDSFARLAGAVASGGLLLAIVDTGFDAGDALAELGEVRRLPVRQGAGWVLGEGGGDARAGVIPSPIAAPSRELIAAGPAERLDLLETAAGVDVSAPVAALLGEVTQWEARARAAQAEAAASLRDAQLARLERQRALIRLNALERSPLRRLGRLLRGRRGRTGPD